MLVAWTRTWIICYVIYEYIMWYNYHHVWYDVWIGYVIWVSLCVICDIWACYWRIYMYCECMYCVYMKVLDNDLFIVINWKVIPYLVWWMKFIFHIYGGSYVVIVWGDFGIRMCCIHSWTGECEWCMRLCYYIHRRGRTWLIPFIGEVEREWFHS